MTVTDRSVPQRHPDLLIRVYNTAVVAVMASGAVTEASVRRSLAAWNCGWSESEVADCLSLLVSESVLTAAVPVDLGTAPVVGTDRIFLPGARWPFRETEAP